MHLLVAHCLKTAFDFRKIVAWYSRKEMVHNLLKTKFEVSEVRQGAARVSRDEVGASEGTNEGGVQGERDPYVRA